MTREGLKIAAKHVAITLAFLLCAWKSFLIFGNYVYWSKFSNDFGVYWRAANQAVEAVYLWPGRYPFPYMPTMLLWTSPLEMVPQWPAYFMFIGCSTAALILACRPYLSKAQIALVLISPPFLRGIFTGQVCAILSAMLIWACGARNRILAGVAFGVIASIKPQLVLMAPLMLALNRDWRAFLGAAATFAVTVFLSLALFGPARWFEWVASMTHFRNMVVDFDVIHIAITPASVAQKLGYPPIPFMIIGGLLGLAVTYLCRDKEPLEKASAIALGSLLAAPYGLAYDLTALVPLLVLTAWRGNLLAVPSLAAMFNPLALAVSLFAMVRVRLPNWRARHATV